MRRGEIYLWRLAVSFALCACVQIYRVVVLRRKGQSWTAAFANSNKLMTGNVWWDAALLIAIVGVTLSVVFAFFGK